MSEILERTGQITYFWYLNQPKIDSMFSQIHGRLESERTIESSKGVDGKVSTSAELGGILATLGLGKLSAAAEASGTASKVLTVTQTLSPENKALVLAEYLQRAGQLGIVNIDTQTEDEVLQVAAGYPFHLVHGHFNEEEVDDDRARCCSEAVTSSGAPLIEIPLLYQHMLPDQSVRSEWDYMPHGALSRIMVRPGRLSASPIAIWYAAVSPLDYAITYWHPKSEPVPQRRDLELPPTAAAVPAPVEEESPVGPR